MACGSPIIYAGVPDYEAELEAFVPLLMTKLHRPTAFRFLAQFITNVFTSILPVKANHFDPLNKDTWPYFQPSMVAKSRFGDYPAASCDPDSTITTDDGVHVDVVNTYSLRAIPDTIPGMVWFKKTKEYLIWKAIMAIVENDALELEILATVTDDAQITDPSIYPLNIGIGMDAYINHVKLVLADRTTHEVVFRYSSTQDCLRIPLTIYDPDQPPKFAKIDEKGDYIDPDKPSDHEPLIPSTLDGRFNYVVGTSEVSPFSPGCSGNYHISYMIGSNTVEFSVELKNCHYDFVLPHMICIRKMVSMEPGLLLNDLWERIALHIFGGMTEAPEGHEGDFISTPARTRRDGPVKYIRCRGCDDSAKLKDYMAPCGCGNDSIYPGPPRRRVKVI
jgi:hypothetical protein